MTDKSEQLSSLLVRDGLVSTQQMTQAFQRQVLRGGNVDTALLELDFVDELTLNRYLALATGLPPATAADLQAFDAHVRSFFSVALAQKYDAIPLVLAADAVRILVHDAVTYSDLENLADELNLPLQPFVTTEMRWQEAAALFWHRPVPPRFAQLLAARGAQAHRASIVIEPEATKPTATFTQTGTQQLTPVPVSTTHASTATNETAPARPHNATRIGLPPSVALAALEVAQERDEVVGLLLQTARTVADYVALLRVADNVAEGEAAQAEAGLDATAIDHVRIPLDIISPFRTTLRTQRPYVGPLMSNNHAVDTAFVHLGGGKPSAGFVMPLVIRARVVALLVGYSTSGPILMDEIESLGPVVHAAETALVRVLLKRRGQDATSKRRREPTPVRSGAIDVPSPGELMEGILRGDELAQRDGVGRFAELLPDLIHRFPGPLLADRRLQPGLRAIEYGPLLAFVASAGSHALDLLVQKVEERSADTRFFATVCLGEVGRHTAIPYLAARALDSDPGVRAVAIAGILRAPLRDRAAAAIALRPHLRSDDDQRVTLAVQALTNLRDPTAVPDLITLLDAGAPRSTIARDALVTLTKHDFGLTKGRWQIFWNSHKHESRTEWLIAATGGASDALRREAHLELIQLHGDVVAKPSGWLTWWRELHV